jgi:folate-binding protein YgfZ
METATTEPWEMVEALDDGRGFVDRSEDRAVVVRGADARGWLGDLVTADIASLVPGSSCRSLLLTPTGRIRADMWITQIDDDAFLVVQARDQPEPADDLLRPYVLSSAVRLERPSDDRSVFLFPAREEIVTAEGDDRSVLIRRWVGSGSIVVGERAFEIWRVGRGNPRMGIDFEAGALPAEAGLERLIDVTKGCFLGQESVAKVRNLGHPPTVLRHLRCDTHVIAGTSVSAADRGSADPEVGRITSAAPARVGGTVLLARVQFRAADVHLIASDSSPLFPDQD